MERETGQAMSLGTTLALLAGVIGLISMTVFIGNSMRDNFFNGAAKTAGDIEVGALTDLASQGETIMSTAEVYGLLVTYESGVHNFECHFKNQHSDKKIHSYDVIGDGTCLGSHLTGDCKIVVNKSAYGGYDIAIYPLE